ncbi:MAG: DUF4342 domain-containing protein [Candidatus Aminicenantes bacterium]|nr:DUF4342 domain-containing protein [Candidatus Aminicenantes bacterium]
MGGRACPARAGQATPRRKEANLTEEKKEGKTKFEEFRVTGGEILDKFKEIIHEGNVRRIILKDEKGKTFLEIPLTVGVVGALVAPVLAAVGAGAALASNLTIVVEKIED